MRFDKVIAKIKGCIFSHHSVFLCTSLRTVKVADIEIDGSVTYFVGRRLLFGVESALCCHRWFENLQFESIYSYISAMAEDKENVNSTL